VIRTFYHDSLENFVHVKFPKEKSYFVKAREAIFFTTLLKDLSV